MSLEASRSFTIPEPLSVLNGMSGLGLLEPEIESLETRAHDILSPVNRLPPEIISYIARFVPQDHERDTGTIVPLTHVCQYWRDSIISSPNNWTLISNEREGLAALSLERTKAAPLTIHLNVDKLEMTKHHRFRQLLLSHIQYTRSLSAYNFYTIKEFTQTLPDFPKSMPDLRSLVFLSNEPAWTRATDPFDFSAHTLRNLSLRNIPLYHSFLGRGTLTELTLVDLRFNLHLDALLDFLKKSHSLERASLDIMFADPSLRQSRCQTPIGNRLRHLSISCYEAMDGRALISGIALRRGAALEICYEGGGAGEADFLVDFLPGIFKTHLQNLSSPIFMECRYSQHSVRLLGPGGSFTFRNCFMLGGNFRESHPLPLESIRQFRLRYRVPSLPMEIHPSSFHSLEVLAICDSISISLVFSKLLPNPTSSPLLKTLAFLNCIITEDFVGELAQFASDRESASSASLHRIVIVGSNEKLPSVDWIERLRECVPVVDVVEGCELPKDLL